ncbi:hypothetical protein Ae406Ps2_0229c [Pseudonocardia sp. Ae406_Ps2]|uniref:hypothetical protein n=1 Tax=unclassified Pseudonocardia TaxID=2619320 RepID=UPI00094AC5E0|nr:MULTISPECIES: hypothetical protein [unclassified Pseudonocardia]OLM00229.1 hypothetical protein Ae406Ps2_0229c [Pseudonocardia sp. Ae406_Ps2]OLM07977.1 hypothetical protein Ae331Ps2_5687 [Pseudonocardia sp. Ae331_Ps2]OLM13783.1 hypothetical protein Ae505Ps2_3912c [Pseudonocardia sp. Ae505_Ps2]OLM21801.1 hypothetical protein Ae706Ps2_0233c [Pseudonocardia sp. Ae706_Ps2]OLM30903.1 hypothetical protein Ae717Ps2_1798c [Pseudonocardia sp. Ae717_Ps2]
MSTLPDPAERGVLEIDPAVLRKIVEYAADTAPATRHRARRVAGLDVGESGPTARVTRRPGPARGTVGGASGDTTGDAGEVDVRLRLTLAHPGSVRAAVAEVRERIDADLRRTTGHRLRGLTVEVEALRSGDAGPRPASPRVQ